ncbi:MAG: hypothetical protein NZ455_01745 [Bacteroidia bacterium]|nr:hypothetical protein [Bacteroidia bacterium]
MLRFLREACGGQAVRLGAKPLAHALDPITRGGRVGCSTVSPQHADPSAARDTPKNVS